MKAAATFLFALSAVPAFSLDLTPQFVTTRNEGFSITRPHFIDGERKFAVTLDTETEVTAAESGVLFRFTKLRQADMQWTLSPFSVDTVFQGEALARYEQAARRLLPAGAVNVIMDGQIPNPWPINGWKGHSFLFRFQTAAGEIRESVTFLNITATQQIVVRIASFAKDFEDVSERGYDTVRRWHEVVPDADAGGS